MRFCSAWRTTESVSPNPGLMDTANAESDCLAGGHRAFGPCHVEFRTAAVRSASALITIVDEICSRLGRPFLRRGGFDLFARGTLVECNRESGRSGES